jgi:hypothetical protein
MLAIHYSNLPWARLRLILAIAFFVFGIWAVWLSRSRRRYWIFLTTLLGVVVWWVSIRPSPNRLLPPEVAVMPRMVIEGDRVRIVGYRNFDYRSTDDFAVRYEDREVSLGMSRG